MGSSWWVTVIARNKHKLIPVSLPDIGQLKWKLFSNILEALLMNYINLTLKLGHCIVDFNRVLNNWSAIQEKGNKFFKKSA